MSEDSQQQASGEKAERDWPEFLRSAAKQAHEGEFVYALIEPAECVAIAAELSRLTAKVEYLNRGIDYWHARNEDAEAGERHLTTALAAKKAEADALRTAFVDTAKALGCEPDNEAMLAAIDALKAERDALRKLLNHGEWFRHDGRTHLAIRVADGADLSCKAMRDAAIDAAIAAQQGGEVPDGK